MRAAGEAVGLDEGCALIVIPDIWGPVFCQRLAGAKWTACVAKADRSASRLRRDYLWSTCSKYMFGVPIDRVYIR